MGLLGREIEAQGVTTVALGLVKEVAMAARAPRFLYLHWPFGHALGEPGNVLQQRTVLRDMLSMGMYAPQPGMVVELPYLWKRQKYEPITNWDIPSEALMSALAIAKSGETKPVSLVSETEGMLKRGT